MFLTRPVKNGHIRHCHLISFRQNGFVDDFKRFQPHAARLGLWMFSSAPGILTPRVSSRSVTLAWHVSLTPSTTTRVSWLSTWPRVGTGLRKLCSTQRCEELGRRKRLHIGFSGIDHVRCLCLRAIRSLLISGQWAAFWQRCCPTGLFFLENTTWISSTTYWVSFHWFYWISYQNGCIGIIWHISEVTETLFKSSAVLLS